MSESKRRRNGNSNKSRSANSSATTSRESLHDSSVGLEDTKNSRKQKLSTSSRSEISETLSGSPKSKSSVNGSNGNLHKKKSVGGLAHSADKLDKLGQTPTNKKGSCKNHKEANANASLTKSTEQLHTNGGGDRKLSRQHSNNCIASNAQVRLIMEAI